MENKYNDIETIIADHKPHVLGLSEANLRQEHDLFSLMNIIYIQLCLYIMTTLKFQELQFILMSRW